MTIKIFKIKPAQKIGNKQKVGYSDIILKMAVDEAFTVNNDMQTNTSIYNAIKNVKNYRGHSDRVYKSVGNPNGTRTWWRER